MDWGATVQASARLNRFDDPEGAGDEVEDIEGPMPFPHYLPGPEAYDRLISLPQDHPEAPWNQQDFMEEHPVVWDDAQWNQYLYQMGGLPPQIAFDEAQERARLWSELQKPTATLVAIGGKELQAPQEAAGLQPTVVQDGVVWLNEVWKPKAERSPKKAAKWREKQRLGIRVAVEAEDELPRLATPSDRHSVHTEPSAEEAVAVAVEDRPRRSKDYRPRGRRDRAEAVLISANTTGSGSAYELLKTLRSRCKEVVAVALQEHWCRGEDLPDLQAKPMRLGWKSAPVAATSSEKGHCPSAGVAIAVPQHLRLAKLPGQEWDASPSGSPGRIAKAWVQAVTPCGLLVISVYLWTSEGLTQRNREIISTALGEARAHGGPWVILGDFNLTPEELRQGVGHVIDKAGGAIWAPSQPTFYPSTQHQPRTIDYALIDTRITGAQLSVHVPAEGKLQGHRAVEFRIKGKVHNPLYWTLAAPRTLPRAPKCGCARRPVTPSAEDKGNSLDALFKSTLQCMEAEICRRNDLVDQQGRPLASFLGRGNGAVFVQRRALPPRNAAEVGDVPCPAQAMRWIASRAVEMNYLGSIAWQGRPVSVSQLKQAGNIVQRFRRRFRSAEGRLDIGEDQGWKDMIDRACNFTIGDDPQIWQEMAEAAAKRAHEFGHRVAQVRRKAWRSWVAKSVEKGAGACHAYVRRQLMVADGTVGAAECLDASPQAVVDQDLITWKGIWEKHRLEVAAPWRSHCVEEDALLEVIAQCIRKGARSFKETTAIGVDGIPPKIVSTLSDELLQVVAELLNRVEEVGEWPGSHSTAVLHLIPKSTGGRRPIGLLPTLVRLWERVRRGTIRSWRDRESMPFNWSCRGKGSEAAVWQQSVRAEAAVHHGHTTATIMVDLVKAFESVPLWRIWEAGLRRHLPTRLLRLALEACSFTRRLVYNSAFSAPVETLSAILAGGGMAVDLLALAMEEIVDEASRICPAVTPFLVVDDLTFLACGPENTVIAQVVRAARNCIEQFEDRGMVVSRNQAWNDQGEGKSIALASTPAARRRLATSTRAMGIPVKRKVKNLGVDYGPGSRTGKRVIMLSRWAKVKDKAYRVKKLGKLGAPRVFNTGLLASVRYGVSLTGVTDSLLHGLRSLAASTYGNFGGASTTGRLALRSADPAVPLLCSPVKAWLTAIWERSLDAETLRCALTAAQASIMGSNNPHTAVQGGAGAYVAALLRVGWKASAIDVIVDQQGETLHLGQECDVKMVLRLFEERLTQVLLNLSSVADELSGRARHNGYGRVQTLRGKASPPLDGTKLQGQPWIQPVVMAIAIVKGEGAPTNVVESLRSMAEGGWWPQARLQPQGYASDLLCQVCHAAEGTCMHRLIAAHHPELEPDGEEEFVIRQAVQHSEDPLYYRGIPAWPAEVTRPEGDVQVLCRPGSTGPYVATGNVYTDGALTGLMRAVKRAGWAAVALRNDRSVEWAVYGICGERDPSILRAELRAVLEALRMALPPLVIHTDNAEVVGGFQMGKERACQASREGADLWRLVWQLLEEIGPGVEICKVKAHTTESDVLEGLIDHDHHVGNTAADALAVYARRAAEARAPTAVFRDICVRTVKWYRWCRRVVAHWVEDTKADDCQDDRQESRSQRGQGGSEATKKKGTAITHKLWTMGGGSVMCQRCGLARASAVVEKFRRQPCRGCPSGRLLARLCGEAEAIEGTMAYSNNDMESRGARPSTTVKPRDVVEGSEELSMPPEAAQLAYEEDEDPFGHLRAGLDGSDQPAVHQGAALELSGAPGAESESARGQTKLAGEHVIRRHGSTAWCEVCGRWAIKRVGLGLSGKCAGSIGSYAIRRERLRAGKHPLTGQPL